MTTGCYIYHNPILTPYIHVACLSHIGNGAVASTSSIFSDILHAYNTIPYSDTLHAHRRSLLLSSQIGNGALASESSIIQHVRDSCVAGIGGGGGRWAVGGGGVSTLRPRARPLMVSQSQPSVQTQTHGDTETQPSTETHTRESWSRSGVGNWRMRGFPEFTQ